MRLGRSCSWMPPSGYPGWAIGPSITWSEDNVHVRCCKIEALCMFLFGRSHQKHHVWWLCAEHLPLILIVAFPSPMQNVMQRSLDARLTGGAEGLAILLIFHQQQKWNTACKGCMSMLNFGAWGFFDFLLFYSVQLINNSHTFFLLLQTTW